MGLPKKIMATFARFGGYCHEPIQIFIAIIWIIFGVFTYLTGRGITSLNVPYNFSFLGQSLHGFLLIIIGFVGLYGVWKNDRRADFTFAAFSTFKSTAMFIELIFLDIYNPEWVTFGVRAVASMLLLNRAIYNFYHRY